MNKQDIANVYRRFTRRDRETLPTAESLVALVDGEAGADSERLLGDVGRSGVHADLLRFAHDLAPESARLGGELERAFEQPTPRAGRRRDRRAATAPRRGWLRIASALAAGVFVAIAAWTWNGSKHAPNVQNVVAAKVKAKAPKADRIFAALDDNTAARRGDVIFRTEFAPDHIFKSRFNGG